MTKRATIRDVAKLASVSLATASRALNDTGYPVSEALRQRVREAAAQLSYVPNPAARSLRKDIGRNIGIIVPNFSNPFYLQTMLGINDVLSGNGYMTILCNSMRDVAQERELLHRLYEQQVKGVILSSVDHNADIVKEYMQKGLRFVFLDQKLSGIEGSGINFDIRSGAKIAVEHMISLGHRRIAFATMALRRWTRIEMHHGYCAALDEADIPHDKSLVYECAVSAADGNSELEAGKCAAEAFIRDGCPATGILCVNDMVAIGFIKTLLSNGIRVPEDVSVCGFDDIPFASAFHPALTTVHYPALESGRLAAMMMIDILTNGTPVSVSLDPRLVIRDTVAPPKITT